MTPRMSIPIGPKPCAQRRLQVLIGRRATQKGDEEFQPKKIPDHHRIPWSQLSSVLCLRCSSSTSPLSQVYFGKNSKV
ncbi:hypothetical protein M413DRAFT_382465 [Hebeloma cylindrosporum]|uniref:Uncharacterized protein n=1 Tax=Hebeloma cylindrosporum TaxID=76867 RepID=A0A0C2YR31_HEBCY|nr:hypothetical protein M413DRAFT_382465 [Hebeloma cylindrosporum h7]